MAGTRRRLDENRRLDIMSSPTKKRPDPFSECELRQFIRIALDKGYFGETLHAESGHPERNITVDDVIHGLEREDWKLAKKPEYSDEHQSWKYLIRTVDIDGDELNVLIAAYPSSKRFEVITRW